MKKSRLEINFPLRNQITFWLGKPYLPECSEFLLNHSRSALVVALNSIGLQKSSRIGVMVYNCHTVMNAVRQCGFEPVFIDVTNQLTINLAHLNQVVSTLDALIVTHLFGIVNDVAEIKRCHPNLIIIEDCAHAYGINHIEGDFATYSIGQGKLPSIGDGGILLVNNSTYLPAVKAQVERLESSRSFKLFMKLWIKSVLYTPVIYGVFTHHLHKYKIVRTSNPIKVEPVSLMDRGVSAIYKREREKIPNMINIRQKNFNLIDKSHKLFCGINAFMACGIYESPAEKAKDFISVDTSTHFKQCIEWAKYYGYVEGTCPMAEYLTKHLLVVPTYCKI